MISYPTAKINLGLDIIQKRPDGYHDLNTVFLPLKNLTDILEILPSGQKDTTLECYGPYRVESDMEQNLVMKAYRMLEKAYCIGKVEMHLYKRIPFQAGLGGGSADASFALLMLRDLFQLDLREEELLLMAKSLGADCPVFIKNAPCYAEGIGDRLESLDLDMKAYRLMVIKPDLCISTKAAFQGVTPHLPDRNCKDIVLNSKPDLWKEVLKNDFEASLFPQFPLLGEIKEILYQKGALYASLSGSGSALYGIFQGEATPSTKGLPPGCDCFFIDL